MTGRGGGEKGGDDSRGKAVKVQIAADGMRNRGLNVSDHVFTRFFFLKNLVKIKSVSC